MEDRFVSIKNHEGLYSVDALGNIRNDKTKRVLKQSKDKDGYLTLSLRKKGVSTTKKVSRLVAIHFIPNTKNKPEVNHDDGNKQNNIWWNLSWMTSSENQKHNFKLGISSHVGTKNSNNKLSEEDILKIRELRKTKSLKEIASMYGITAYYVSGICLKRTWKHI